MLNVDLTWNFHPSYFSADSNESRHYVSIIVCSFVDRRGIRFIHRHRDHHFYRGRTTGYVVFVSDNMLTISVKQFLFHHDGILPLLFYSLLFIGPS